MKVDVAAGEGARKLFINLSINQNKLSIHVKKKRKKKALNYLYHARTDLLSLNSAGCFPLCGLCVCVSEFYLCLILTFCCFFLF